MNAVSNLSATILLPPTTTTTTATRTRTVTTITTTNSNFQSNFDFSLMKTHRFVLLAAFNLC